MLLETLNSENSAIQFTMENSDNNLPFLDIIIDKKGNQTWMDINSKPKDPRKHVPFNANHPKPCLKNNCTIVQNPKITTAKLSELKICEGAKVSK